MIIPSLQENLSKDVADIIWQYLQPHAKRDAIILVQEQLNLPEVAAAIIEDNSASVQDWIRTKAIAKPTAAQLTDWNNNLAKKFDALII